MGSLQKALELVGTPVAQGASVVIYFPATGTTPQGNAILPIWKGTVKRVDTDALVVEMGAQIVALSWDHIAGLQVVSSAT